MTLSLTNTMKRAKEPFVPANPDHVTMYVCGPTVYNLAHIGNARPARDHATADRLRAELAALGTAVEDRADGSAWRRTG